MEHNARAATQPFLGCWSLLSWTITTADGRAQHPYGEDAWGRLMYHPGGQMAACLMRRQRTRFVSANRLEATIDERDAAYREHMSYLGTFTVQPSADTVTHHVEAATYPNWIGTDLVRSYQFSEELLTLSVVNPQGAKHVLVWKKDERIVG